MRTIIRLQLDLEADLTPHLQEVLQNFVHRKHIHFEELDFLVGLSRRVCLLKEANFSHSAVALDPYALPIKLLEIKCSLSDES